MGPVSSIPTMFPGALAAWTRAIGSGEAYEVEFRLRRADGAFRWFLAPRRAGARRAGRDHPLDRHQHRRARPETDRRRTRRTECDAGAARRGKDPGARPDLERVAGPAAGRRSQRRLANRQSGLDPDARLERGRIAQPHLGMAGASRRRRSHPRAGRKARRQRNHRQVRKPLPAQGRIVPLAVMDRRVRTRITSMRWPATSPRRRPRPNG